MPSACSIADYFGKVVHSTELSYQCLLKLVCFTFLYSPKVFFPQNWSAHPCFIGYKIVLLHQLLRLCFALYTYWSFNILNFCNNLVITTSFVPCFLNVAVNQCHTTGIFFHSLGCNDTTGTFLESVSLKSTSILSIFLLFSNSYRTISDIPND